MFDMTEDVIEFIKDFEPNDRFCILLIYQFYQDQFLQNFQFCQDVSLFITHTKTHLKKLADNIYHLLQKETALLVML